MLRYFNRLRKIGRRASVGVSLEALIRGLSADFARPDSLVPRDHPLRAIRLLVNAALERLSPVFATIYADAGRPSIPPEKLLRAPRKDFFRILLIN